MKNLLRKSLLVLMVAFIAVFALGVTSKVKAAESLVATFDLGEDGSATHSDGSSATASYTETVNSYTLSITSGTKMYPSARDAKGNGCIKLGTSSAAASFTITVPSDIIKVSFYVAGYKANTAKVSINSGATATISTLSNDGEYTAISVDTTETKTVTFETVSGGYRCMIDKIEYYKTETTSEHTHTICTICGKCKNSGCTEYEECPKHSLSISGDSYTKVGAEITLTSVEENLTESVVWTSSDNSIATVSEGVVTTLAMGTVTITASANGLQATKEIKVYPDNTNPITVAEALQVCQLTGETNCPFTYSVVGTISSIDTPYDSGYNNITVTITDGTNSIKAFRMKEGSELLVDQQIKVTGTLVNYGGDTPEFIAGCTYEMVVNDSTADILELLNNINAHMSLAYKYTTIEKEVAATTEVSDVLNLTLTGMSGTTYDSWSGKTVTSSAVWAGQSAGSNDSIQLRSNNNSGVVTTASGGKVSKIIITWNSNTSDGRTLDVYGSNTAYTNPTELYSDSTKGEKLGSIVKGTSTELEVSGDYAYIGLRSNSGAMYITSIEVVWAVEGEGTTTEMGFTDVDFRIKCGVDKALANVEGVESYGIKVSTSEKSMKLTATGDDDLRLFAVVSLGDVLTNAQRLDVVFTVQAYVVIDGVTYVSNLTKSYSVREMVKAYYDDAATTDLVAPLYNLITE